MYRTVHGSAIHHAVRGSALHQMVQGTAKKFRQFGFSMFYVYVFLCADKKMYVGYTQDLRKRVARHQKGQVNSTKARLPVKLIFYESYINKYDALRREKYLKTSKGKQTLTSMLKETFAKV